MLHNVSDATIALAGFWCLLGWLAGLAFAVAVWWRPITRNRSESATLRLYRMQLEDSDRQLSAALAAADRMAWKLADAEAALAEQRRVA